MLYLKECVTFKILNGQLPQIQREIQHSLLSSMLWLSEGNSMIWEI